MKTLSLDLRERIVGAYDAQEGTREEIASRFRVSLGMVKKLLQQRRKTNELGHRHRYSGRKAKILPEYRDKLTTLVAAQPDLTLAQIRQKLAMSCTVPAVHYALVALGLTYKKRRSTPPNRAGPMSPKHGASGRPGKASSRRVDSSSSTSRPPKRT
jgi:transposase